MNAVLNFYSCKTKKLGIQSILHSAATSSHSSTSTFKTTTVSFSSPIR